MALKLTVIWCWPGPATWVARCWRGGSSVASTRRASRFRIQRRRRASPSCWPKHGIRAHAQTPSLARRRAVLLMAVKPQIMEEVFPPLAKVVGRRRRGPVGGSRPHHPQL